MNIILLSGGSGKRLWPLSNDIRSKQFVKLFRKEDGSYESMVQRVMRQVREVDPEADITIATSKSQASAIKNQLGDMMDICIEPCRRDTFPAIALAVAYLHDKKSVGLNESVAVCPVDPYVENTYYDSVKHLTELSKKSEYQMLLMGITPTCPSEKYGYIIPESKDHVSHVLSFKEKPDTETARKYIAQGALWNAGVFAFQMGYFLEKVNEMIGFSNYDELLRKYESIDKISFDYAVAEREKNMQVYRYDGEWKDIGTWNMISEVMDDNIKGKVLLDETCENVNVVNELDIPVLCMGGKDLIIAVSSDGILVSDKEQSGYMKPYVDQITGEAMFVEKSWGTYTVINVESCSITIKISMTSGNCMSYHSHDFREEVWTVVSGTGRVTLDGVVQRIEAGDVIKIATGVKHSVYAETDLDMIEVQIGDGICKADKIIYR